MPYTKKAQGAAGAELGRRREGIKRLIKPTKSRPMGHLSVADLRKIASNAHAGASTSRKRKR